METKNRIMQSAFKLFANEGIDFSLSDVAREVGIKKASIYAHFENKYALINSVIHEEIDKYFFVINQENDDLKRIFFGVLDYYDNSRNKLLFWKRLLLLPGDSIEPALIERIRTLSDQRYEIITGLIAKEIGAGSIQCQDPEVVSLMFVSMIHGLLSSSLIYHARDIKQHYECIWSNFWKSVS